MRRAILLLVTLLAAACGHHGHAHGPVREVVFAVGGMDCAHCAATVREALAGCDGVVQAQVDFDRALARVEVRSDCDLDALARAPGEGFTLELRE